MGVAHTVFKSPLRILVCALLGAEFGLDPSNWGIVFPDELSQPHGHPLDQLELPLGT